MQRNVLPTNPDTSEITEACAAHFSVLLFVREVVADNVDCSHGISATVFRATDGNLYALLRADESTLLRDVQRAVRSIGLHADRYYPPNGDPRYFTARARQLFERTYPKRPVISASDLDYYKTLVPYGPALVKIDRVTAAIRRFDPRDPDAWPTLVDFSYRRVEIQQ